MTAEKQTFCPRLIVNTYTDWKEQIANFLLMVGLQKSIHCGEKDSEKVYRKQRKQWKWLSLL